MKDEKVHRSLAQKIAAASDRMLYEALSATESLRQLFLLEVCCG